MYMLISLYNTYYSSLSVFMTNTTSSGVTKPHKSTKAESCQTANINFLLSLSSDGKNVTLS